MTIKSLKKNTLTALGTGTSTGIPMIGCQCVVCTSLDHRDQRMRTSIFLQTKNGKHILVDTSPDLRTQLLSNQITHVDFAIITHDHADHLHGIDDLRPLSFYRAPKEIPLYTNADTALKIKERFGYIFPKNHDSKKPILGGGIPKLTLEKVELEKWIEIEGEKFYFFNYPHGHTETMGFIHDQMAYIVDCMELPQNILTLLSNEKLKLLVIDCLQRKSHSTHLTLERSFDYITTINPETAGLIHIGHDLSHQMLSEISIKRFGKKVFPLYDNQKIIY